MHHGAELGIVLSLVMVLVLGAATRAFSQRTGVPFSVAVLVLGILAGSGFSQLPAEGPYAPFVDLLVRDTHVTPDLILLVFLPILVFESAWSLDVHALRKDFVAVLFLAGPVLLVSTVAVGAMMVGLTSGSWGWSWPAALVFGALISATDPVAVVALLRELGAPKRLGVLIEGESLLNDGTSIVVFTVLVGLLTGEAHFDLGQTIWSFLRVAGGGVAVGLVVAIATTAWLGRTFNQPLIEISLTLGMAYAAMAIAEGLLHVSGVIAVVTAGLWLAGPGRTHISPEVQHFQHRFWEALAWIANTAIFFLVGLVIASAARKSSLADWGTVALGVLGVVGIRVLLSLASAPFLKLFTDPVSPQQALVMGWGGLRGAVSLALALMVLGDHHLEADYKRQVLVLTTAVVFGTIVINGSSTGWLLRRLGFDKPPPGERLTAALTRDAVLGRVGARLEHIRHSPELRTVNWGAVEGDLQRKRASVQREVEELRHDLANDPRARREGTWRQVLSIERAAYWNAFASGTLGAHAVRSLDQAIDHHLDRIGAGDFAPPPARAAEIEGLRRQFRTMTERVVGISLQLARLERTYDVFRAEAMAASEVLDRLGQLEVDSKVGEEVARTYAKWRQDARQRLEDLRIHLPELTRTVETRIARRVQLNFERDTWRTLEHEGAVDPGTAREARRALDQKMKELQRQVEPVAMPSVTELCRHTPLFSRLDEAALEKLAAIAVERVFEQGEVLFEQGETRGSVYIVARGTVAVHQDRGDGPILLDVLGTGEVVGELTPLIGAPRSATLRALTTLTVGEIDGDDFRLLLAEVPELSDAVWHAVGRRRFDNHIRGLSGFENLGRLDRIRWFDRAEERVLADGERLDPHGLVFVTTGALVGWATHEAPSLVQPGDGEHLVARGETRIALVGSPP